MVPVQGGVDMFQARVRNPDLQRATLGQHVRLHVTHAGTNVPWHVNKLRSWDGVGVSAMALIEGSNGWLEHYESN